MEQNKMSYNTNNNTHAHLIKIMIYARLRTYLPTYLPIYIFLSYLGIILFFQSITLDVRSQTMYVFILSVGSMPTSIIIITRSIRRPIKFVIYEC